MDRWLIRSKEKNSSENPSLSSNGVNVTDPEINIESVSGNDDTDRELTSVVSPDLIDADETPPAKKKRNIQKYRLDYTKEWPCLWKSKSSEEHIFCSVCVRDVSINHGGRDDCRRHIKSALHQKNSKASETGNDLSSYLQSSEDGLAVMRAELLFTTFVLEHNLPISCSDHAGSLFKKMFPDSKIATKYACGRTKTSSLIKCLSSSTQDSIIKNLKSGPFALATDGSNDKNDVKLYPLVVSFFQEDLRQIVNMILSMVECSDNTGQGIFNAISEEFKKKDISWENCVAFASDNAKTMTGHVKGVISYIKNVQPDVNFQGCVCHLLNIAAKKGCLSIKNFNVEIFLVNIYFYLEKSSKRQHAFQLCQDIYGLKPHKILKYVSTRWLSLLDCIKRVLEQWDPLVAYFCVQDHGTKNQKYTEIKDSLDNPVSKVYLLFLKNVLPVLVSANIFLQQEKPLIHLMRGTLEDMFMGLVSRFIKPEAVEDTFNSVISLDFSKKKIQKPDTDLVIGADTRCHLKKLSAKDIANFYHDVREFYVTSLNYIKKKLPVDDSFLRHAQIADITLRKKSSYSSVEFLISKFPHVLSDDEKNELEVEFSMYQFDNLRDIDAHKDRADTIWYQISLICDGDGNKKYSSLSKLILALLLVPHSNATSERVFSLVRKNQTDFRPTLGCETLTSLLVEKQKNFNHKTSCYESKFSKEFLLSAKKSTWLNLSASKTNDQQLPSNPGQ